MPVDESARRDAADTRPTPDVDVIVPSYGTRDLTARAVRSALAAAETRAVIVVDNDSPDDSAAWLAAVFAGAPVEVVRLDRNRGFGAACNAGAARAAAPWLFFLNSDAVVVSDALRHLRRRLERDADVGVVAPAVRLAPEGPLQGDAQGAFPTAWSILLRTRRWQTEAREPDWVSGVAFAVRRQEFLALGGFDAAFFMYYEDVDLCRRYREAGFRIVRELDAEVVHAGGASRRSRAAQKSDSDRSQDLWLLRNGTAMPLRWLVRALRRVRRLAARD